MPTYNELKNDYCLVPVEDAAFLVEAVLDWANNFTNVTEGNVHDFSLHDACYDFFYVLIDGYESSGTKSWRWPDEIPQPDKTSTSKELCYLKKSDVEYARRALNKLPGADTSAELTCWQMASIIRALEECAYYTVRIVSPSNDDTVSKVYDTFTVLEGERLSKYRSRIDAAYTQYLEDSNYRKIEETNSGYVLYNNDSISTDSLVTESGNLTWNVHFLGDASGRNIDGPEIFELSYASKDDNDYIVVDVEGYETAIYNANTSIQDIDLPNIYGTVAGNIRFHVEQPSGWGGIRLSIDENNTYISEYDAIGAGTTVRVTIKSAYGSRIESKKLGVGIVDQDYFELSTTSFSPYMK